MQKYEWIFGVYVKKCSYEKVYWVYDKNKSLREIKTSMVKVPVRIKRKSISLTAQHEWIIIVYEYCGDMNENRKYMCKYPMWIINFSLCLWWEYERSQTVNDYVRCVNEWCLVMHTQEVWKKEVSECVESIFGLNKKEMSMCTNLVWKKLYRFKNKIHVWIECNQSVNKKLGFMRNIRVWTINRSICMRCIFDPNQCCQNV